MVDQGEILYTCDDDDAFRARGLKSVQRDLSKAQSVLEDAEDWVARLQEDILNNLKSEAIEADADMISDNGLACIITTKEKERELLEKRESLASLIRDFLAEADEMPIVIEEAGMLRLHLQALDWVMRVRPTVVVYPPIDSNEDSTSNPKSSSSLPRPADLFAFRGEIAK